jgi:hypothetical protein
MLSVAKLYSIEKYYKRLSMNWQVFERKLLGSFSSYYTGILMEELRKTTKASVEIVGFSVEILS